MSIRKLALAAILSASLSSAPVMAQTTAYQPVAAERVGVEMTEANAQDGGFPFLIVFVVVAIGLGLYFAVNDSANDEPTSP